MVRDKQLKNTQKVLEWVTNYIRERKISPTVREITEGAFPEMSRKSYGNVSQMVNVLIRAGFLRRAVEGGARSLMVVDPPPAPYYYRAGGGKGRNFTSYIRP